MNAQTVCRGLGSAVKSCVYACTSPADCSTQPAGGVWDADNYACQNGGCVYIGCNDDAECAATYPGWVCRSGDGTSMKWCFPTCSTVADCPVNGPANDADNTVCRNGLCFSTGCNSDAECSASGGSYVCR
jgi:hypothetical protein